MLNTRMTTCPTVNGDAIVDELDEDLSETEFPAEYHGGGGSTEYHGGGGGSTKYHGSGELSQNPLSRM